MVKPIPVNLPDIPVARTIDSAQKDGTRFKAIDDDGNLRECWWGKTSHVPLYGWCWNDGDPENTDLWCPIMWWPPHI